MFRVAPSGANGTPRWFKVGADIGAQAASICDRSVGQQSRAQRPDIEEQGRDLSSYAYLERVAKKWEPVFRFKRAL
jgi:hypothetical protein